MLDAAVPRGDPTEELGRVPGGVDPRATTRTRRRYDPAGLARSERHGSAFELSGEPIHRYRCWVGHVWSPESLLDAQGVTFEKALWMALQSLDEKAELARRMASTAQRRGSRWSAGRFDMASREATQAGQVIRDAIERLGTFGALADDAGQSG